MFKRHTAHFAVVLLGLAACAGDAVAPSALNEDNPLNVDALGPSPSSGSTVVVTETDISRQAEDTPPTNNWVLYTRLAGTGTFTTGPGTPPLGVGSITFVTPTPADKVQFYNYDHIGTKLADIRSMSYSTFRGSSRRASDRSAMAASGRPVNRLTSPRFK